MVEERKRSPNDQRPVVFNPTSGNCKGVVDNRNNQINQNNPTYKHPKSRER
jgi:hypothetical protein